MKHIVAEATSARLEECAQTEDWEEFTVTFFRDVLSIPPDELKAMTRCSWIPISTRACYCGTCSPNADPPVGQGACAASRCVIARVRGRNEDPSPPGTCPHPTPPTGGCARPIFPETAGPIIMFAATDPIREVKR